MQMEKDYKTLLRNLCLIALHFVNRYHTYREVGDLDSTKRMNSALFKLQKALDDIGSVIL